MFLGLIWSGFQSKVMWHGCKEPSAILSYYLTWATSLFFMSSTLTWYNFCITLCSNTVVQCSLDSFRSFTWINASLVLWNAQRLFSTILLGDISQCWWFTSGCVWIASMCKCKLKQWEARYVRRFLGLIHHGCVICILLLESPWQVKWDVFGDLSKIQAL